MRFWEIANLTANSLDLMLYGPIFNEKFFDEDVTPTELRQELEAAGPNIQQINVYVNSPGGNVFAGQAIHSMLVRHQATVTVYVDGLAASIASVIAMAGDRVIMPRNAMMMVHSPWTLAIGNADELRDLAEVLDTVEEGMIAAYERRVTISRDELKVLLDAETWLTAAAAVQYGFADEVEEEPDANAGPRSPLPAPTALDADRFVFGDLVHNIAAFSKRPDLQQQHPGATAVQHRRPTERPSARERVRTGESRAARQARQQKLQNSEAAARRHERESRHV